MSAEKAVAQTIWDMLDRLDTDEQIMTKAAGVRLAQKITKMVIAELPPELKR